MVTTGLTIKKGADLDQLARHLRQLAGVEVLVGFPEDKTEREVDPDGKSSPITNAALAYIHDNGAPEQNIPARQFMAPAIADASDKLSSKGGQILQAVLAGGHATLVEQGMHQLGLIGKLAIQKKINEGIPPPLAESTLLNRISKGSKYGQKGAKAELERREKGLAPSVLFAKPLVDTGQLRNAADYAIRPRSQRKS